MIGASGRGVSRRGKPERRRRKCQTEIARDHAGKVPARDGEWDCVRDRVSPDPRALAAGTVAGPDAGVDEDEVAVAAAPAGGGGAEEGLDGWRARHGPTPPASRPFARRSGRWCGASKRSIRESMPGSERTDRWRSALSVGIRLELADDRIRRARRSVCRSLMDANNTYIS